MMHAKSFQKEIKPKIVEKKYFWHGMIISIYSEMIPYHFIVDHTFITQIFSMISLLSIKQKTIYSIFPVKSMSQAYQLLTHYASVSYRMEFSKAVPKV